MGMTEPDAGRNTTHEDGCAEWRCFPTETRVKYASAQSGMAWLVLQALIQFHQTV